MNELKGKSVENIQKIKPQCTKNNITEIKSEV